MTHLEITADYPALTAAQAAAQDQILAQGQALETYVKGLAVPPTPGSPLETAILQRASAIVQSAEALAESAGISIKLP